MDGIISQQGMQREYTIYDLPHNVRVSQLSSPDHGGPAAFILCIDETQKAGNVVRGAITVHNKLCCLQVALFGGNVKACHTIGTL